MPEGPPTGNEEESEQEQPMQEVSKPSTEGALSEIEEYRKKKAAFEERTEEKEKARERKANLPDMIDKNQMKRKELTEQRKQTEDMLEKTSPDNVAKTQEFPTYESWEESVQEKIRNLDSEVLRLNEEERSMKDEMEGR